MLGDLLITHRFKEGSAYFEGISTVFCLQKAILDIVVLENFSPISNVSLGGKTPERSGLF